MVYLILVVGAGIYATVKGRKFFMDVITLAEQGICKLKENSDAAKELMIPNIFVLCRGIVDASLHIGVEPNLRKFWSNLITRRKRKIRSVCDTAVRGETVSATV